MSLQQYILRVKVWLYNILADQHLIKDIRPTDYYVSKISDDAPWVYSAYLASVFYHLDDQEYMNAHQSRREAVEMVRIWNQLGYNVYVQDVGTSRRLPNLSNVHIVFGHEPQMERASNKYKSPIRIYYATGAYHDHNNAMVKQMTDRINEQYSSNIPYRRLQQSHRSYDIATHMLMIGSRFTKETFPEPYRKRITIIHQSFQPTSYLCNVCYAPENEYFYMGSAGNMLRGVPLLVEYFIKHTDLTLHLVGPIEKDYYELIKGELTPNIIIHGSMDINSDAFRKIVARCNFVIYPSGSEGLSGSLLNSMKNGLIPIVTRWAAFDEINDYGHVLSDWSVTAIDEAMQWAIAIPKEKVTARKKACQEYVLNNFTIERFCSDFEDFFKKIAK